MPTMRGEAVTLEWPERGVALATMTRAEEMNTLSLELLDELGEVAGLTRQERARALIITGSGRAFCCGAHLKYFEDPASPIGTTPVPSARPHRLESHREAVRRHAAPDRRSLRKLRD
jgi:enoyl-CoA hydratase/carnithine racemase